MKTLRLLFTGVFSLLFSLATFAQEAKELKVKVFFHCANGKALLEKEMAKVDGVKAFSADLQTKVCTVAYDEKKLNQDKIVAAIEKIGYLTEFSKKDAKINKACSHDHGEHEGEHKH